MALVLLHHNNLSKATLVNFFDSSDGKLNVDKYSSISLLAPSCAICAAACNFFVSKEL